MFDRDLMPFLFGLNSTIMWISLTVGILLFIIGYFAGGRLSLGRIIMCTSIVTFISVLSLPAPMALYQVVKDQFSVQTYFDNQPTTTSDKISSKNNSPAASSNQKENASTQENKPADAQVQVPVSFQVLTLVMHVVWTAFLIAMGIFFYETLIVTAQEAEKR